jgi:RimJ/RimL family protein N-acetyltransferase
MQAGKVIFEGQTSGSLHVLVRYPAFGDVKALWKFINTLSSERTFILFQGEQLSLDDEEKYVAGTLDKIARQESVQLLAFSGDALIGSSKITLNTGVSRHVGGFGITIAQGYRGRGVGTVLMETVIDEAVARLPNLKMITLQVFGNNTVAMSLYKKLGFVEYGRLPGGILHRDQYVDEVHMYKVPHERDVHREG